MKQSQREIAQALDWFADLLESNFREQAHRSILAIAHPSMGDYTRRDALIECADVIEETRRDMKRMIPDA